MSKVSKQMTGMIRLVLKNMISNNVREEFVRKCTQEVETPLRKLYNKPDHEVGRYSGKRG